MCRVMAVGGFKEGGVYEQDRGVYGEFDSLCSDR